MSKQDQCKILMEQIQLLELEEAKKLAKMSPIKQVSRKGVDGLAKAKFQATDSEQFGLDESKAKGLWKKVSTLMKQQADKPKRKSKRCDP